MWYKTNAMITNTRAHLAERRDHIVDQEAQARPAEYVCCMLWSYVGGPKGDFHNMNGLI